jgi:hypothetical protein
MSSGNRPLSPSTDALSPSPSPLGGGVRGSAGEGGTDTFSSRIDK